MNTQTPVLNPSQEEAATKLRMFLASEDRFFRLSGGPGTGKTFMIGYLISRIWDDYQTECHLLNVKPKLDPKSLWLTATTHKAVNSLQQAILPHTTLFNEIVTIHSFLKLKVIEDNQNPKITKLISFGGIISIPNALLIIDEASMIGKDLYNQILQLVQQSEHLKVIFVGDSDQMAPVKEDVSPVYKLEHTPPVRNATATLTQPVRNASAPALVYYCDQLRETVRTKVFKPLPSVTGQIDHCIDPASAELALKNVLARSQNARVLCYTNERVQAISQWIRKHEGWPKKFSIGEKVLINGTGPKNSMTVSDVEYTIINVYRNETKSPIFFNHKIEYDHISLTGNGLSLSINYCYDQDCLQKLVKYCIKNNYWEEYNKLRNSRLLYTLNSNKVSTVYKAQGSTFDEVFVDVKNISTCRNNDQLARMLYVGVSRARHRVTLFGDLPPRLKR